MKYSGTVLALVVYTGKETKLMQNLGNYKLKRSQMERRVSFSLLFNLVCFFLFILVSSVWHGIATSRIYDSHHYIFSQLSDSATVLSLKTVISLYLVYNYLIPLDLAVTLEFIAIFYSAFILWDVKMAHTNRRNGNVEKATMNSLNLI